MKLTAKSYLILAAVAVPFLAGATAPAGCDQAKVQAALGQVQADILTVEQGLAIGSIAFCASLPQLQADADAVLSVTTIDATTQKEVAAGKAAAAAVCQNPSATNLQSLVARIAAAKAGVQQALAAAPAN